MLILKKYKKKSFFWRTVFDITSKKKELNELEKETQNPDFWKDQKEASLKSKKLADLKEDIEKIEHIKKELEDIIELEKIGKKDPEIIKELELKLEKLEDKIKEEEIKTYFSGKYDKRDAIMQIVAGTGGVDAEDWATMILRMYQKYCQNKKLEGKIIDQSSGEGGGPKGRIGIKSVTLEIKGKYAYGLLKKESGVHRLVRISPFSSQSLRHTSFVMVEVLPKVESSEVNIKPDDLKIQTLKSSGPGGQYVNKRESAVRITHLPTGITVASQSERLLGLNKEKAMEILYAKLYQLEEERKQKELENIKGKEVLVSWGNQIRSYVFHPYQMVKDLRTNVETSNVDAVLDGDLEKFIQAELKI